MTQALTFESPGTLAKEQGEPKEAHEARLGVAGLLFDVHTYVEDFARSVVPAYRTGVADRELPADAGVARSIVPPGTASVRDFSTLAPTIPQLIAEKCVGCMACVSACPDSAILGIAVPEAELEGRLEAFAATQDDPLAAATTARRHFMRTQKYAEVPAKKGLAPASFGIFVDPVHCKGCAECVEVCAAQGHDALIMIEKLQVEAPVAAAPVAAPEATPEMVPAPASGTKPISTVDRYRRDMAFFRTLPTTPREYRNEKVLADLMLGEHAFGYVGGAGSCSGCGEASVIRMVMSATQEVYGPEGMGIVAATGCNTVYGSTYPFNPFLAPWTNSLFENAPADAMGIRQRWDQAGHPERRIWVFGGDGAMYDIGFQSLSRMVASGADIKALVLDTQAYSNTGGQASTASFGGQVTKLSAYGREIHGRPERRKELSRVIMAHDHVYVAQTTAAHINHCYRAIMEANSFPGPAVIVAYTPCMPEHGIADDAASRQARLAVDGRAFPLWTYDPRRGQTLKERLSLQGNPALRDDWMTKPDGSVFDFLAFARTEGRFAGHFAGAEPTPEIMATQEERLANWRGLQELAGLR